MRVWDAPNTMAKPCYGTRRAQLTVSPPTQLGFLVVKVPKWCNCFNSFIFGISINIMRHGYFLLRQLVDRET